MPSKRGARKAARDGTRLAGIGDYAAALAAFDHAAAEYREHLTYRTDPDAQRDLVDLLEKTAASRAAAGDRPGAAAALAERLRHLTDLGEPARDLAAAGLDLADAHLSAGHLLSAATVADDAVRAHDHSRTAEQREHDAFAEVACALARNARILAAAGDPDLAVGAADQSARMLLSLNEATESQRQHLRSALTLACRLHAAAGRQSLAAGAGRLLARHFGETGPAETEQARPLSLRGALEAASRLGTFGDTSLIDRLCPDPASHAAPPAISARCDPGLAAVALHAVAGAVELLQSSHAPVAWRLATEIHYLLTAADRQGERNLRLNFRDHGPTWLGMMLCLTGTAARSPALGADLAGVLEQLLERLRLRHASGGHDQAVAQRYIDHYRQRHLLAQVGLGVVVHRLTQVGGQAHGDLVVGFAERRVVAVERAQSPVGLAGGLGAPQFGDEPVVLGDDGLDPLVGRRGALVVEGGQAAVELFELRRDRGPLGRAHLPDRRVCGVDGRVAPAAAGLGLPFAPPGVVESFEPGFGCHRSASFELSDGVIDGGRQCVEPFAFVGQLLGVPFERVHGLQAAGQDLVDRLQAQAEAAQQQDLLEPQQFGLAVAADAAVADRGRGQQADRVVVPQRAGGDAGQLDHFGGRPGAHRDSLARRCALDVRS